MLLCLCGAVPLLAEIRAASLFGDNMVLQREISAPVWGTAAPGEAVTVTFHEQVAHTVANGDGQWCIRLKPMQASTVPGKLVITGKETMTFTNVLVGEVWVCSGQSNMEWALGQSENAAQAIAAADYPQLRMFTVGHAVASIPQATCQGNWTVCGPKTAGGFSATGFYFARCLQEQLRVPVGMINASYGGTRAEPWTSLPGLKALPSFRQMTEQYEHARQSDKAQLACEREMAQQEYANRRAAWYRTLDARDPGLKKHWMAPDADISGWWTVEFPCAKNDNPLGSFIGSLWCRKTVEIPQSWVGKLLELHLGVIDETDDTYINGVHVGRTWFETPEFWKVSRVYPVPAALVTSTRIELTVRMLNLYYDLGCYGPAGEMKLTLKDVPAELPVSLAGSWRYTDGLAIGHGEIPLLPPAMPPTVNTGTPAALFNGMIHPLIPYAIRGVIWYQGESNAAADAYPEYHELFTGLITSWRAAWGQGDFPFAFVQLANYLAVQQQPVERASWAELRAAQAKTLALPNTTMAVIIDIGAANNIHPKNKQDVGTRLALSVLANTYHQPNPLYTGPCYQSFHREGAQLRLRFRFARGLTCKGDSPTGFAIAGNDKVYHRANARIDRESVIVWSPEVPEPVAARYGWANNPPCNLYNAAGLPMAPFRTDNWDYFSVAK